MLETLSSSAKAKFVCARYAAKLVKPDMLVGLGTGSTALWLVKILAERQKKEGLNIRCVPTSSSTYEEATKRGLTCLSLDDVGFLDIAIDGADEVDPKLNLIKGGGGALLQEKIVAMSSARFVVVADNSKMVEVLGKFPLPIEVIKFGHSKTKALIEELFRALGYINFKVTLREKDNAPFQTDEGHYIYDAHIERIVKTEELSNLLLSVPGVVETGLFINIADEVVFGDANGQVNILSADHKEMTSSQINLEDAVHYMKL